MSKSKRTVIKLLSSAGTSHFYTTTKNRSSNTKKLKIKKFDPVCKKHVFYTEEKIK